MKYKELIQFEPITSVVQLASAQTQSIAESLVKTFVFSKKIQEDLNAVIIRNLSTAAANDTKGIQIVGNYGTGKSHLMSLVSCIAENEDLLELLSNEDMKARFQAIGGKYKVLSFGIETNLPLSQILTNFINRHFDSLGITYECEPNPPYGWKEQLKAMMAAFEEKYPTKHFLIVIDEMLNYLKGRGVQELYNDLTVLQALGEACDNSRFKFMFGVQEMLYRAPEFQFQATILQRVEDRYADLIITKEDVAFVVKERLLKKDLHQKQFIREHLLRFAHLFEGISQTPNEYIDLFPVHPSYISSFEKIKHGKSQREILKVLSEKFGSIMDTEVPHAEPGLITFDTYWPDLAGNPSMLTTPDIRIVKDKMDNIDDLIGKHFTGVRAKQKDVAQRIANALAISVLYDDLDKRNGATGENLKENLCLVIPGRDSAELLLDSIASTANQLVKATSGQYVEKDELSGSYFIREESGVNIPQLIRNYADENLKRNLEQADQYFFDFLQYVLGIQQDSYRTGFKIWQHSLEWTDKRSFRLGYIFFGNPNNRSTTEPIQQYYLFFSPLFNPVNRNDEPDEVYFDMKRMSEEFKDTIYIYGAAKALHSSAPSNQKLQFDRYIEEYRTKAIGLFNSEFSEKTDVVYQGDIKTLKSYPLLGQGSSKDMIFNSVAARVLNPFFNTKFPHYPAFKDLTQPLSEENFEGAIKAALKKIQIPSQPNRTGEAILSGLGLWSGQAIDYQNSRYAGSILSQLKAAGAGSVLNRADILYNHYTLGNVNLWYSKDFQLEYQLEFVVLAALVFKGDIEISWSGSKSLSATNLDTLSTLTDEDFFTFQHIKQPQGLPIKPLRALFSCLGLPDYTTELEKPDTITAIITEAKSRVERVVKTIAMVNQGLKCRSIDLLNNQESQQIKSELDQLRGVLDSIQSYNTYGKLKSFRFGEDELATAFKAYAHCEKVENLNSKADKFEKMVDYLYRAQSYVVESEKPLYDDIHTAINQLPEILSAQNATKETQYSARLTSLSDRYADYYVEQYTKNRLSSSDAATKRQLMEGEKKRICDIVRDISFISSTEYNNWVNSITSLKEADASLTKKKVLAEPYHDFNPRENYGKPTFTIRQLEDKLDTILEGFAQAMKSVCKDPSIQATLDLLKPEESALVEDFRTGRQELTVENAPKLRDLITRLSQGMDKVEITWDNLRKHLSKPLTPQEAIDTLTAYIDELCAGKERNKVRIVMK